MLDRLEEKFGRHAIRHLTAAIIMTYVAAYLLQLMMGSQIYYYLGFSAGLVAQGQIWRIFSWILIPPDTLSIWTVLMLFCIYQQGTMLERIWGNFKFDFYIFNGIIFTLIGGIILSSAYGGRIVGISTYYVMLSVFLGLALTFPNMEFRFMFLIPIRAKYLVVIYAIYLVYEMVAGRNLVQIVMIVASVANMAIFFFLYKKGPRLSRRERETRRQFRRYMNGYGNGGSYGGRNASRGGTGGFGGRNASGSGQKVDRTTFAAGASGRRPIHRCAVCGRTELDDPNLEFRFCSKCKGNYEYCQDHLYNHKHVE